MGISCDLAIHIGNTAWITNEYTRAIFFSRVLNETLDHLECLDCKTKLCKVWVRYSYFLAVTITLSHSGLRDDQDCIVNYLFKLIRIGEMTLRDKILNCILWLGL
ncbi:hypothetical protein BC937DRAFT_91287 [Endogone sp. FLAS-F59071]|nr:hypothetical protein BC937DRAFT_91287 [Endogone sp. FLAS-F59071]|eukprot:RUS21854.1 hypothetical protein BC937DRAFT_91287 [Endogone sp. FLAS-F59071]